MKSVRIAVLLLRPVWSFDLNAVIQIFDDSSRPQDAQTTVLLDFVAPGASMELDHGMSIVTEPLERYRDRFHPDIIILPGFANPFDIALDRRQGDDKAALFCENPQDAFAARAWVVGERQRGCEIAAMCTGVFALGWMGLLDGVTCTTHLPFLSDLEAQYPKAIVAKDRVITYDERHHVWTAAGGSVCLDLCLALLGRYVGEAVASTEVSMMGLPYPRSESTRRQTQPATSMTARYNSEIIELTQHVRERLSYDWTLTALAQSAHMSPRTFQRRFNDAMGVPPRRWLLEQRLKTAKELLELTDLPMYAIASRVGMHDSDSLRKHFSVEFGVTPTAYRAQRR